MRFLCLCVIVCVGVLLSVLSSVWVLAVAHPVRFMCGLFVCVVFVCFVFVCFVFVRLLFESCLCVLYVVQCVTLYALFVCVCL